jgi:hypothetical protein
VCDLILHEDKNEKALSPFARLPKAGFIILQYCVKTAGCYASQDRLSLFDDSKVINGSIK